MKDLKMYLSGLLFFLLIVKANGQSLTVFGKITLDSTDQPVKHVIIQVKNIAFRTYSDTEGNYSITIPYKKHVSIVYKVLSFKTKVKEFYPSPDIDSIKVNINMVSIANDISIVSVFATRKPDTLLGSPDYSIYDFDFFEDKFILLTAARSLKNANLKLTDAFGKIITSFKVPEDGGEAKEFYHDYMGYTNLICTNFIYRINMYHDRFVLIPLSAADVNTYIKPIVDTINGKIIYTDYWKDYPMFSYYSFNEKDSVRKPLYIVENTDLMHAYNFEYYSMKPRARLDARRLAMDMNVDKHIVAALMSGFTQSMFYEPLYAPLYVIKDTICIFDHYKDRLYHFNKEGFKTDSFAIKYNHPKNWKEWKNKMLKDEIENKVYAVYEKNGHKYIKEISLRTGREMGKYNLQFHSADKIKIQDGYAYYIYRPFESTQQKFFYRELISLQKTTE